MPFPNYPFVEYDSTDKEMCAKYIEITEVIVRLDGPDHKDYMLEVHGQAHGYAREMIRNCFL